MTQLWPVPKCVTTRRTKGVTVLFLLIKTYIYMIVQGVYCYSEECGEGKEVICSELKAPFIVASISE